MSKQIIIDDPRFLPTKKTKKKISKKLYKEMNSYYYEEKEISPNFSDESGDKE